MKTLQEARLGYSPGDRVRIHAASILYKRGVRYAVIHMIGRQYVHLNIEDGRRARVRPSEISGLAN